MNYSGLIQAISELDSFLDIAFVDGDEDITLSVEAPYLALCEVLRRVTEGDL